MAYAYITEFDSGDDRSTINYDAAAGRLYELGQPDGALHHSAGFDEKGVFRMYARAVRQRAPRATPGRGTCRYDADQPAGSRVRVRATRRRAVTGVAVSWVATGVAVSWVAALPPTDPGAQQA